MFSHCFECGISEEQIGLPSWALYFGGGVNKKHECVNTLGNDKCNKK